MSVPISIRLCFVVLYLLCCMVSAQALDRITMKGGDIFLGNILSIENERYVIERFGVEELCPTWFVKQIEEDIDELEIVGADSIPNATAYQRISSATIEIEAKPPIECSHLELFPISAHFWVEPERYLRGYLVNQTQEHYRHISVEIRFYDVDNKVLFQESTDIFMVCPMTMKPFIIDAMDVPWKKVDRIRFQPVSVTGNLNH